MRDILTPMLIGPADLAAQRLLNCQLIRMLPDGWQLIGRIVETEAYDQSDAASHSYKGRTPRTDIMFGPAGHLYVYFTYGMHYCCNVVTGPEGQGAAVLIRAVEPLEGIEVMAENRRVRSSGVHSSTRSAASHAPAGLTNGPAKLCQAFGIDMALNGHDLRRPPLQLIMKPALPPEQIVQTTRVGISQAKDVPWRFYIKDNPYVSKPNNSKPEGSKH